MKLDDLLNTKDCTEFVELLAQMDTRSQERILHKEQQMASYHSMIEALTYEPQHGGN